MARPRSNFAAASARFPCDPGVSLTNPDPVWDCAREAPTVLDALGPPGAWLETLRRSVPVARSTRPFKSGPYLRLRGHLRSFCFLLPGSGVIAVKGGEILAQDLDQALEAIKGPRAPLREAPIENFPLLEQKAPMALLLEEALDEASLTARFQAAHLARYGTLARAPVPLLVGRWSAAATEAYLSRVEGLLSSRAARVTRRLAREGLGFYAYYYPGVPVRTRHLREDARVNDVDGYGRTQERLKAFGSVLVGPFEPQAALEGWLRLAARMMVLGFFPCSLAQRNNGQCLSEQNACLDGGLLDLDSLEPFDRLTTGRRFTETFLLTWMELSTTALKLLTGALPAGLCEAEPARLLLHNIVLEGLRRQVHAESQNGTGLDPRLVSLLEAGRRFENLEEVLSSILADKPGASAHSR